MKPSLPLHTIVVIQKTPFDKLAVGDIIAFRTDALGGKTALHRIVRIADGAVITKGDANHHEDSQVVTTENYEGKCVLAFRLLGQALAAVHTPLGFVAFLCLPLSVAVALYCMLKRLKPHTFTHYVQNFF